MPHRAAILVMSLLLAGTAHSSESCSAAYWSAEELAAFRECATAAHQGDPESQFGYGLILWSGHGRQQEPAQALGWLRAAAGKGHLLARITLGRLLSDPQSPAELRNPPEAYAWWLLAGEKSAAPSLRSQLSPAELVAAEKLSLELTANMSTSRPATK